MAFVVAPFAVVMVFMMLAPIVLRSVRRNVLVLFMSPATIVIAVMVPVMVPVAVVVLGRHTNGKKKQSRQKSEKVSLHFDPRC